MDFLSCIWPAYHTSRRLAICLKRLQSIFSCVQENFPCWMFIARTKLVRWNNLVYSDLRRFRISLSKKQDIIWNSAMGHYNLFWCSLFWDLLQTLFLIFSKRLVHPSIAVKNKMFNIVTLNKDFFLYLLNMAPLSDQVQMLS